MVNLSVGRQVSRKDDVRARFFWHRLTRFGKCDFYGNQPSESERSVTLLVERRFSG